MSYENSKKYFETAYRTGSDIWTHKNYRAKVLEFLSYIPKSGELLDIGTGRGIWPFIFADEGFRVTGIDYVQNIVDASNQEVYFQKKEDKIKFIQADVFDLPFEKNSFETVTDFGLAQHLRKEDFDMYRDSVVRVLKPGGHILNVSFSKHTEHFLDFNPKDSPVNFYESEGVPYYFFTDEEVVDLYGEGIQLINQEHIVIPEQNNEVFVITLLQKM